MVKLEKIEGGKVSLEIQVDSDQVEEALGQAYRKVVKKAVVPGFRKGKVPRSVLEARFGPEVLYEDALEILIPRAYSRALEETELEPIDQPQYDLVQMEKGKPLVFKAEVDVKPEVKLPQYKGIKAEKKVKKIDDTHVDGYLDRTRNQHARLVTVEDQEYEVVMGDMVVIDFTGYIGEEPFEGGEAEGYSLELGSNSFIPGFEEQLAGARKGKDVKVAVTFPGDYHQENLAGKEAVFHVKVQEIKRKELPSLNDEFIQEISEQKTLSDYREEIRKTLQENEENRAARELEEEIIARISGEAEVEAPHILVERELDRIMGEMERVLRMQGLDLEQYLKMTKQSLKDLRNEHREEGVKRVTANLTLDAIIKEEGITAGEEEVQERIDIFAAQYKQDPQKVKELFASQGRIGIIEEEIKFRKVIDFLVTEAEVEVVEPAPPEGDTPMDDEEPKEEASPAPGT